MRRIDRTLGVTLCAVLTAWRRVADRFRRQPPDDPQKILIVKLAEHGAWVVAYSALTEAIEMVGAPNVYVMTFSDNRFVLDQMQLLPPENILEVPTPGPVSTLRNLLRAVRQARRLGIDATIDFEFFARSSAVISYLTGASRRVGFHANSHEGAYRGDLMTHRVSCNPLLHAGATFHSLVDALRISPDQLPALPSPPAQVVAPPMTPVSESERTTVARLITEVLGTSEVPPLVLLNANAGDLLPLRRWPSERYVELAQRLLNRYPDVAVAFTGSPAEAAEADRLAMAVDSPRCVSLGGRTTLRELIVLYGLATVMVTNDSGPAHYAALAPVDIVTLFGPETPHVFGSLSPRNHSLWAELACSPCVNAFNDRVTRCTNNLCMQAITVDQVEATVAKILERTDAAGEPANQEPGAPR
ncbi:MAG: glycosyltransferase family 9 protein [Actinomycetes bacterium]